MQIVSVGDNLHEISILFARKNQKSIINLSAAEFAHRVVRLKCGYRNPSCCILQFVEIKSNLFKKVDVNHLYQISCSDARERFHYVLLLSIVCIRNMTEVAWNIGKNV